MSIKVSIITTFYNSVKLGDFVHKAMKCLLNQTYKNIEFICVNDGSSDETLSQLKYYKNIDDRIIIIDKINEGTAQYAKAAGQDIASGDYIMLFDHDDEMSNDAVEKAVNTFREYPELDMVSFVVKVCFSDKKIKEICYLDEFYRNEKDFVFKSISGDQALKKTVGRFDIHFRGFYKKEILKKVSFRFSQKLVNADEIVERQLLENVSKIGLCDGIYTHYIFHNSSAKSFNLKKTDILDTDLYLREYFKNLGYYESRKDIFELGAYKSFVNGLKAYFHYKDKISIEERIFYEKRLKRAYKHLDKSNIIGQYRGLAKIYNRVLLSNYQIIYFFYLLKR